MHQPELAQATRTRQVRRIGSESRRGIPRVTVTWTPSQSHGLVGVAPTEIELVALVEAGSISSWTCAETLGSNWVEAISSARCREVVLTARLGGDLAAKHSVLELVELLTFRLTESQPLIRVLFEPRPSLQRGTRSHA